jgi:hypothetical protein
MTQRPATRAELIEVFGEPARETSDVSRKEGISALHRAH